MTTQRITLSYDDEKHSIVHLGLQNHSDDSDSAYLRKCIEFFELNKSGTNQQLILERLATIERMLKKGVVPIDQPTENDPDNDDLFDDLLEQIE